MTGPPPDIQACWVDPMPERDTMAKFEGKSVAEPIARWGGGRGLCICTLLMYNLSLIPLLLFCSFLLPFPLPSSSPSLLLSHLPPPSPLLPLPSSPVFPHRFYRTNHVRRFMLKRPFHRGVKDKQNEYKVSVIVQLCAGISMSVSTSLPDSAHGVHSVHNCLPLPWDPALVRGH